MHRSYQPLKPASSRLLQHRWDRSRFHEHRHKVKDAKPVVETQGTQTPAHIQHKLKKVQVSQSFTRQNTDSRKHKLIQDQNDLSVRRRGRRFHFRLQDERLSVIDRDNRLLSSRLNAISRSAGLVDHRNHYSERSLNAEQRREKLLQVTHENQAIYQRISTQRSQYRRELWEDDWEKVERRRDDIARFPRGLSPRQRAVRRVTFTRGSCGSSQRSSSGVEDGSGQTSDQSKPPST